MKIIPKEHSNVRYDQIVTFKVIVFIPSNAVDERCNSTIQLDYRYSANGINDYEEYRDVELITHAEEEETTLLMVLIDNSILAVIFLTFATVSGYTWYGRQYFFLSSLYSNIPKEKLLNSDKREQIKDFLTKYNGSNLTEIAVGTGINVQTLRHHMRLLAQSEIILKKDSRYFIKIENRKVFDTDCLSPILQKLLELIKEEEGVTIGDLISKTKRSKPWMGKRLHALLVFDIIELYQVGRYKYIFLKGNSPNVSEMDKQMHSPQIAG